MSWCATPAAPALPTIPPGPSSCSNSGIAIASRFLLRDLIRQKFADKLGAIDTGVKKEGGFYLFTLRLVPAFPFFVVNLALGLTSMKAWTFYWVSQIGMLLGTIVYVNAGTEIARIDSLKNLIAAEEEQIRQLETARQADLDQTSKVLSPPRKNTALLNGEGDFPNRDARPKR